MKIPNLLMKMKFMILMKDLMSKIKKSQNFIKMIFLIMIIIKKNEKVKVMLLKEILMIILFQIIMIEIQYLFISTITMSVIYLNVMFGVNLIMINNLEELKGENLLDNLSIWIFKVFCTIIIK